MTAKDFFELHNRQQVIACDYDGEEVRGKLVGITWRDDLIVRTADRKRMVVPFDPEQIRIIS